jgi:hypothetical protein
VRYTVKRNETAAHRASLVLLAFVGVVAAGGVMAAPGLDLRAISGLAHEQYAVRIVLPTTHRAVANTASPAGRRAPLIEPEAASPASDEVAPVIEAAVVSPVVVASAPVALAAPSTLPVPTVARAAPRGKVAGLMRLSYNLAGGAEAGDAIEIDKPVSIAGVDAGHIPIRIDGNAKVYAQGKRLAALIAAKSGEKAVPAGLGEGYVSLEALRALGIGVKYDAIHDRLVLDPPAA